MKIYCQDCRKEILVQNINIQNFIAKCHHCDSVFQLNNNIQNENVQSEILDIPCPKDINVIRNTHELVLELKNDPSLIYTLLSVGFFIGGIFSLNLINVLKMYYLIVVLLGILLFIKILLFLKKHATKTIIRVNSLETSVDYGILSFRGKKFFSSPSFKQLYCQEHVRSSRRNRTYIEYPIKILTHAGTEKTLISIIINPEEALFVERTIEKYLNIADKNVPDAYK